jgi:hypothetical protein
MKKVIAIILSILSIGLEKTTAQEKTMPMDSTMMRDNMSVPMDKTPTPPMDIAPVKRDNTRTDNMPMKRDTTPMQMDKMRRDTVLNGIYNGQKIRSDTVRNGAYYNGMKLENLPKNKVKPQNKKELDGTQNGKYNYEMSRDSMPDAKNIDPYRKRYGSKYGDKMARNTTANYDDRMRAQMAKEDRGVLMHRGRTMIVKNGQKTFIKSYTYLSYGTKVMSDGTIIKQDGTKTMMKQGEFVNMMGEIVPMKE